MTGPRKYTKKLPHILKKTFNQRKLEDDLSAQGPPTPDRPTGRNQAPYMSTISDPPPITPWLRYRVEWCDAREAGQAAALEAAGEGGGGAS